MAWDVDYAFLDIGIRSFNLGQRIETGQKGEHINISWGRILSVAIPVSVALIVGIWIGQELIRPQVTIQYGLFSKNLKRIETELRTGDTNAALSMIEDVRRNLNEDYKAKWLRSNEQK